HLISDCTHLIRCPKLVVRIITVRQYFIEDLCNQLISLNVTTHEDALLLIRFLIADRYIEVDLSTNIVESGLIDVTYVTEQQGGILYGAS
nr:hypothetical protein [Vibrio anguillarum]